MNNSYQWQSHGITNVGKVRKLNEDSMLEKAEAGLWVVADGMGGHSAGDFASQSIVSEMDTVDTSKTLANCINDIETKIIAVNERLFTKANETSPPSTIGSTVAMMLMHDKYCVYLWGGDSRVYRLRDKKLVQMTTDHSQVEVYIEKGLISREEAATHPHGNMITRAVGATQEFFLDMDIQEMRDGDRYLVCSDGLTKHILDKEFETILNKGSVEQSCVELVDLTLERGAGDNVTSIVIDVTVN